MPQKQRKERQLPEEWRDTYLTINEACRRLGCCRTTLLNLRISGVIASVEKRGRTLITIASVDHYLK